jgi:hypothetical protein
MPSLSCAGITRRGAPRNCLSFFRNVLQVGRYRRAPPSGISYAAMAWGPRHDSADTWALRGSPPARAWPPTMSGAPIFKATSKRATGSTVIRSPWPMATAASCSAARRSPQPVDKRPSRCSPACSTSLDSRNVSVRTTACPLPPIPSPVCHGSPRGGCAGASCRSSLSPVNLRTTAAMNGCTGRSQPRPLVRGALRQCQRGHPVDPSMDQRLHHLRRGICRPRGDCRWHLECLLRPTQTRSAPRTTSAHRRGLW